MERERSPGQDERKIAPRVGVPGHLAAMLAMAAALYGCQGVSGPRAEAAEPPVAARGERNPSAEAALDVPSAEVQGESGSPQAAQSRAQGTLDKFLEEMAAPGARRFYVQARLQDDRRGWELVWVGDLSYEDGTFGGRLASQPAAMRAFRPGDQILVRRAEVTDWLILDRGSVRGNFSGRALPVR